MTLPRRQSQHAEEDPSAGPHIDDLIERNIQEYAQIADEIVKRLQKDIPSSHLDSVVETVLYRFGRIVADRNRAINQAALRHQQQQQQQEEDEEEEQSEVVETQQPQQQQQYERDRQRLKRWFIDHLSYPYPTNEEKEMLSEECHMTIRQISNWFINVRMRIWTPIIRKYEVEIPERTLFEKTHVLLPDHAVQEVIHALK